MGGWWSREGVVPVASTTPCGDKLGRAEADHAELRTEAQSHGARIAASRARCRPSGLRRAGLMARKRSEWWVGGVSPRLPGRGQGSVRSARHGHDRAWFGLWALVGWGLHARAASTVALRPAGALSLALGGRGQCRGGVGAASRALHGSWPLPEPRSCRVLPCLLPAPSCGSGAGISLTVTVVHACGFRPVSRPPTLSAVDGVRLPMEPGLRAQRLLLLDARGCVLPPLEQRAPSPSRPALHTRADRCVRRLLVQAGDGLFNRRAQVLLVRQRRRCQRRRRRRSLTVARWTRTVLPPPDSPPSSAPPPRAPPYDAPRPDALSSGLRRPTRCRLTHLRPTRPHATCRCTIV